MGTAVPAGAHTRMNACVREGPLRSKYHGAGAARWSACVLGVGCLVLIQRYRSGQPALKPPHGRDSTALTPTPTPTPVHSPRGRDNSGVACTPLGSDIDSSNRRTQRQVEAAPCGWAPLPVPLELAQKLRASRQPPCRLRPPGSVPRQHP